ncbi:RDD family protein [Planococcus sp. YIM B11945]|uniref:RDD family protein n=1 Tax=Planococcus sp. YIM B11945 TaxID=3435410 RepID=UPI003D7D9086
MNELAKKRAKAILIDILVSTVVTAAVEPILRKKVKSEAFHVVATPTLVLWGLEYAQTKAFGQTLGQKAMGIQVVSEDGGELTSGQILKRIVHRDTAGSFAYMANRKKYDAFEGGQFAHDLYAGTEIKEV